MTNLLVMMMDNKIDEMSLDLVREEEVAEEKKCKRRKHHLAIQS